MILEAQKMNHFLITIKNTNDQGYSYKKSYTFSTFSTGDSAIGEILKALDSHTGNAFETLEILNLDTVPELTLKGS
jgi:hypothetical protein